MILANASLSLLAALQGEPQYLIPLLAVAPTPITLTTTDTSASKALVSYERVTVNDDIVRLRVCRANTNCVSSNYREPPNRYVSPYKIVTDPSAAFQRAVRDLQQHDGSEFSVAEIIPSVKYIHLTVPGTAPSSLDDIDIVFSDNVVNLKCQARVTLPPPPFCVRKNCINGNMDQRSKIEKLSFVLGLPASDREEMQAAKWTPIFFNSDRVPGFDEEF